MQLIYAPASPFARKVRVVAIETGQASEIELIDATGISPVNPTEIVTRLNPLARIPALLNEEGQLVIDSRVICEYLDSRHVGHRLIPDADSKQRWQSLTLAGVAEGILDTAVPLRYETALRPEELRWTQLIDSQFNRINHTLDYLEPNAAALGEDVCIGRIGLACALGYLDFRFEEFTWRTTRPGITAWYRDFSNRESMMQTVPY